MVRNVTFHNPIHQEENTPLVKILETDIQKKQSTAADGRKAPYVVDLARASYGGVTYPEPGSQWYLKKVSGVWTLMARGPQQNPQLDPDLRVVVGDTFIGNGGTTVFVDEVQMNDELMIVRPHSTDNALSTKITTDFEPRLLLTADGKFTWGMGDAAVPDTNLYRSGVDRLRTDDEFQSGRESSALNAFSAFVSGDSQVRWQIDATGKQGWGTGSGAVDTNLYRSSTDTLKTDDSFVVGSALNVTGLTTTGTLTVGSDSMTLNTAWTSFTTTWTGAGGNPVLNNGSVAGEYKLFGKFLFFTIIIAMGSTTTFGSGAYSFTIPAGLTWVDNMACINGMVRDNSAALQSMCAGTSNASSGAFDLRYDQGNQVSATTPFTLAQNDFIKIWGFGQVS